MSTTRRAACGACPVSRPPPCSGARSTWPGPIASRLEAAIRRADYAALSWREVEPRLEDVFIHMLSQRGEQP